MNNSDRFRQINQFVANADLDFDDALNGVTKTVKNEAQLVKKTFDEARSSIKKRVQKSLLMVSAFGAAVMAASVATPTVKQAVNQTLNPDSAASIISHRDTKHLVSLGSLNDPNHSMVICDPQNPKRVMTLHMSDSNVDKFTFNLGKTHATTYLSIDDKNKVGHNIDVNMSDDVRNNKQAYNDFMQKATQQAFKYSANLRVPKSYDIAGFLNKYENLQNKHEGAFYTVPITHEQYQQLKDGNAFTFDGYRYVDKDSENVNPVNYAPEPNVDESVKGVQLDRDTKNLFETYITNHGGTGTPSL